MQVIRATDICDGLIVDNLPSLRSSASSWFNVTNSASIATMSPVTEKNVISSNLYHNGRGDLNLHSNRLLARL